MDNSNALEARDRYGRFGFHYMNIALHLVLTLLTCGLWNLYWNYRQMQACNEMLGREEFNFLLWFVLCIVTCGIWHVFYQYKMGESIVRIQRDFGLPVFDSLPIISCILTVLGWSIVVDAVHQHEINKIVGY
jgi:hypothetical protein